MSSQQLTARALSMLSGNGLSDIPKINSHDPDLWHILARTAEIMMTCSMP
ncbi:MAG: hypothetical protein OXF06_08300 [Bacteroidetes bacterium]|nr:hypothetical protein [Bacteroidota bacterium]